MVMPWHCQFCHTPFTHLNVLDQHLKIDHKFKLDLSHRCDICGKSFPSFGDLKTHVDVCRGASERRQQATSQDADGQRDGDEANTQGSLEIVPEVTKDIKRLPAYARTYQCEICGKLMKMGSFRQHKLTHSRDNSCSCDICGRSFNNQHYLTIHSRRTHSESRDYKCDICQKGFKSNSAMRLHGRRAHTAQKLWSCHFCQKSFSTKNTLRNHFLTHTKEKPHQCTMCGRRFTKPDALRVHLRIHTKEKPFSCDDCGKMFSHKVTLVKYHRCPNAKPLQQVESTDTTTFAI